MVNNLFRTYIAEFIDDYSLEAGLSHQTKDNKASSMKRFLEFLGYRDFSVLLLREYLSILRQRLMISSLRCEIKNLKALSNFLVKRRYIKQEEGWADQIIMPKYTKEPIQLPDQATMEKIIIEGTEPQSYENQLCRSAKNEMRDALLFCLRHGLRSEELRKVETSRISVDTDDPTFTFRRKGGATQTLPITKDMVTMVKRRCCESRRLLFTVSDTALQRGAKRLNVTIPIHCHTLRHCFAVEQLRRGTPIEIVSKMLGHKNISVTMQHYVHFLPNDYALYMARQTVVRSKLPAVTIFDTVVKAIEQTGVTRDTRFEHLIKKEGNSLIVHIQLA